MTALRSQLISVFILLAAISVSANENDEFKVVKTEYGDVRGKLMSTMYDAKPAYSFLGIPYAKPPLNELRYKPPVEPERWSTVLDAVKYSNACVQVQYGGSDVLGSEDCLYLNVFVPANNSSKKLPVMLYIHGGGFFMGSANGFGPDFLLNNDVIFVALNYRLGAFGFLSLGTADYSGNVGLKDQLFAMEWVQQNIEQFGGDKDLVTIFGASAGSMSVHLHILSPKSDGLFKRAIMQGGSANTPLLMYEKSDHLDIAYDLAKKFGHNAKNIDELIEFLNNVDPVLLVKHTSFAIYTPGAVRKESELIWSPLIEVKMAKDPFLTKHPQEYLDDKSVKHSIDTLHGYCRDEMAFFVQPEMLNISLLADFNKKFELQLPRSDYKNDYSSKDYSIVIQDVRDFYLGSSNGIVTDATAMKFSDLMSDIWFIYNTNEAVKAQVQRTSGNVFYYVYSIYANLGALLGMPPTNFTAVSHGDDSLYVFYFDFPGMSLKSIYENYKADSVERKRIKLMTNLLTDFAKYGNPTPNADPMIFKPVTEDSVNFVDIKSDGLISGVQPFADRIEFWDQFYKKYEEIFKQMTETQKMKSIK